MTNPSNPSATPEDLNKFVNELSEFLYNANKVRNIPVEFLCLQLQVHVHDMLNWIVSSSRNFAQEKEAAFKDMMDKIPTRISGGH